MGKVEVLTTDVELVTAWQTGCRSAGAELMRRYEKSIWRFFSNKISGPTRDLVQQTLLACCESIGRFERRSSFRVFLFSIARNILYRHYRMGDKAFDPLTSSVLALEVSSGSPAEYASDREEDRLLLRVLHSLPLETQILVELAYWENLSDRDLAEVMQVPVGTIKSRLRKARIEIRRGLEVASIKEVGDAEHHSLDSWATGLRSLRGARPSPVHRERR